jgi:hypothetical protein
MFGIITAKAPTNSTTRTNDKDSSAIRRVCRATDTSLNEVGISFLGMDWLGFNHRLALVIAGDRRMRSSTINSRDRRYRRSDRPEVVNGKSEVQQS